MKDRSGQVSWSAVGGFLNEVENAHGIEIDFTLRWMRLSPRAPRKMHLFCHARYRTGKQSGGVKAWDYLVWPESRHTTVPGALFALLVSLDDKLTALREERPKATRPPPAPHKNE